MRLSEITKGFDGELIRDGEFETLEYCTSTLDVSFLSFMENSKFVSKISKYVTCIFCRKEFVELLPDTIEGIFVTDSPKELFHLTHNELCNSTEYTHEAFPNKVGRNCRISESSHIAGQNVSIGDNVVIEDNVTINENVTIGNDCIIHSGAVIGGKAFTFARASQNRIMGLKDIGSIIIGDRVEIFPMVHIAQGILPTDITAIGNDVKIDALVHIGHGAHIGDRTLIAACALISGNVRIGKDSWVGVNATVSNRIVIGDRARVSLGSVVTKNVADNETVTGNFAIGHAKFINNLKKSTMDGQSNGIS